MKIGDSLYRYCHERGVWEYKIIGILQEESGRSLVLSCESCKPECYGCRIYIDEDTMRFKRVETGENNDSDDYYRPISSIWHERNSYIYHQKRKDALNEMYDHLIHAEDKKIAKALDTIKHSKMRIKSLKESRTIDLKGGGNSSL